MIYSLLPISREKPFSSALHIFREWILNGLLTSAKGLKKWFIDEGLVEDTHSLDKGLASHFLRSEWCLRNRFVNHFPTLSSAR